MFAGHFAVHEMDIPWPRWDIDSIRGYGGVMLVDTRLNTVAFIILKDPSDRYAGFWEPQTMDGYALLHVEANRFIKIPKVENTLFLYLPDGTSTRCKLSPGSANLIGQKPVTPTTDLRQDFKHWQSLSPP
jgi:hypothetical protein